MSFMSALAGPGFGYSEGLNSLNALQKSAIPTGMDATGRALGYDQALLSGDPAAMATAIAPETNAVAGQTEQAKKAISSEGTSRGGGVNAELQKTADLPTKTAVDTITALQPKAAAATAGIGGGLTSAGESAAGTESGTALSKYQTELPAAISTTEKVAGAAAGLAGGGASPTNPAAAAGPAPEDTLSSLIPSQIPEDGSGGDTWAALASQFGGAV